METRHFAKNMFGNPKYQIPRKSLNIFFSVAEPGYLSRIPESGSWFLPIQDPGYRIPDHESQNSNKREGWKKNFVIPFYVATNLTKLKIILVLKWWSGIRKKSIPDPRSRIPDPDPQHWFFYFTKRCFLGLSLPRPCLHRLAGWSSPNPSTRGYLAHPWHCTGSGSESTSVRCVHRYHFKSY